MSDEAMRARLDELAATVERQGKEQERLRTEVKRLRRQVESPSPEDLVNYMANLRLRNKEG
jgi:hypothetical protein